MSEQVVRYSVEDAVATVTLDRPDSLNAWTPEMGRQYFDFLERADADPAVRAIVVTGAGRGFCAGADFGYLDQTDQAGEQIGVDERTQSLPQRLRKPVIAAINGACAGLGLVMAMMCDLRFADRGAKLTTAFVRRGLIAEYGLSWVLPRSIGLGNSLDLLLSGRTFLAEEAHGLGLVERLTDSGRALEEATAYAADLAQNCSPASMAVIKGQVYRDLEASLEESQASADAEMRASFKRDDFGEGVQSFVERRAPSFDALS